jgi:hypothetical protein
MTVTADDVVQENKTVTMVDDGVGHVVGVIMNKKLG